MHCALRCITSRINKSLCTTTVFTKSDINYSHVSKLQPTRCNFSLFIYFYRRSTCFRRSFRPSSGAQNCTYSFSYCQTILLLADNVDEIELCSISSTIAAPTMLPATGRQHRKCIIPQHVYSPLGFRP